MSVRQKSARRRLRRLTARSSDFVFSGRFEAYSRTCERLERAIGRFQPVPSVEPYWPEFARQLRGKRSVA